MKEKNTFINTDLVFDTASVTVLVPCRHLTSIAHVLQTKASPARSLILRYCDLVRGSPSVYVNTWRSLCVSSGRGRRKTRLGLSLFNFQRKDSERTKTKLLHCLIFALFFCVSTSHLRASDEMLLEVGCFIM